MRTDGSLVVREPLREDRTANRARVPGRSAAPRLRGTVDAPRRPDQHRVAGQAASIPELLRGVPFN